MALRLNTQRTFKAICSVAFTDDLGHEQTGEFGATLRIIPTDEAEHPDNKGKRLVDLCLVAVDTDGEHALVLYDGDTLLTGDALLNAVRNDMQLSSAVFAAYQEELAKKPTAKNTGK